MQQLFSSCLLYHPWLFHHHRENFLPAKSLRMYQATLCSWSVAVMEVVATVPGVVVKTVMAAVPVTGIVIRIVTGIRTGMVPA